MEILGILGVLCFLVLSWYIGNKHEDSFDEDFFTQFMGMFLGMLILLLTATIIAPFCLIAGGIYVGITGCV